MGWKDVAGAIVLTLSLGGAAALATAQPADSYRGLERSEIRDLFDRYAQSMDNGECGDPFVKLFAEDGGIVNNLGGSLTKGATAIHDWCDNLWKLTLKLDPPNRIYHVISSVRVDFTGPDTAHAEVMWVEIWRTDPYKGPRGTWAVRQMGGYHDEIFKRNGRWLFGRHQLVQTMPLAACADGPPGTVPPPPLFCDPSLPRHKN